MSKRPMSAAAAEPATETDRARLERAEASRAIREAVGERVRTSDPRQLLQDLVDRWEIDSPGAASVESFTRLAFTNFGVDADEDVDITRHDRDGQGDFGLRELDARIEEHEQEAIAVFNAVRRHDPAGDNAGVQLRAQKVLEMVFYAKKVVLSAMQARLALHELHSQNQLSLAEDMDELLGSWAIRYRFIDKSKHTGLHTLLLYLLDTADEKRYRKHPEGLVFEPIVVDGHETHAWREVGDIKKFVYGPATKKEINHDQWVNLTTGNNAAKAIEHLTKMEDLQFPFLRKDRSVFSFRNGVYVAGEDKFYRFGELPDTVVAAKFFDEDFRDFADLRDWYSIPTPSMDTIMAHQEWPEDVRRWMFVALGRLLYDVGVRDGWQVVPFLHGAASSGKSTIALKVAKLFYEHCDVGVISNNMEKQFGISACAGKLLVVGPEIGQGWRMEQLEFQSMASGESVSVAKKHETASTVEWNVPMILAGNELPPFSDNAGSIQRRFLVFEFSKTVVNGDMRLADKLQAEIAAILVKANRAYLWASSRWGGKSIWTVLPAYFHDTRAEMAQAVNSIAAFLASPEVELDPQAFMSFKEFKDVWKAFALSNSYPMVKTITRKLFNTPFEQQGLTTVTDTREYRGRAVKDEWLLGARLRDQAASGGGLLG